MARGGGGGARAAAKRATALAHRAVPVPKNDASGSIGTDSLPTTPTAKKRKRIRVGTGKETYEELCSDLAEKGAFGLPFSNPLRKGAIYLFKNWYFANFVLLMILSNCTTLALDSQELGFRTTQLGTAITVLDYIFTSIFAFEALVKIFGMGFIGSPESYIREPWNVLDFVVVALSVLGWIPGITAGSGTTAVRTIRVLRPLRTITTIPGLRKIVQSLIESLPLLFDVMVLLSFLFLLYGIIGVELLNGQMSLSCWQVTNWNTSDPTYAGAAPAVAVWGNPNAYPWPGPFATACTGPLVSIYPTRDVVGFGLVCLPGWWCGEFVNSNYGYTNFDNIGTAWLNVMYALTTSGWTDVMYQSMDCLAPSIWIYWCSIVVLTTWFACNLAVAVLYVQFAVGGDDISSKKVLVAPPEIPLMDQIPEQGWRGKMRRWMCRNIVEASWFVNLTIFAILVNTCFLAIIYYGMSDSYARALEIGNIALTSYFGAEMVIKLLCLGPQLYVADRMNSFDAIVVVFGFVDIILQAANINTANLNVLRCFRLLRVFKLARSWRELNRILTTVLNSLASIGYLSMLMVLFFFIMAVLGMQVFGYQEIYCDGYNLGASVQPVCPVGLSTEAGTCPAYHYYDCYAPCDPSSVGQWIVGQSGSFGWPGSPTGLCRAYTPGTIAPPTTVNVTTLTYPMVPLTCNVAMPEVLALNASAPCGAAFQLFSWYTPTALVCNGSDPAVIASSTTPCGVAYNAFTVNVNVDPASQLLGATLSPSATVDGVNTVLLNYLPVVINSTSFGWVGFYDINYSDPVLGPVGVTCRTDTAIGIQPYCDAALGLYGGTASLPTGQGSTAYYKGTTVTLSSAVMATYSVFNVVYLAPATGLYSISHINCDFNDPLLQGNSANPCGAAWGAFLSNGTVLASGYPPIDPTMTIDGVNTVAVVNTTSTTVLNAAGTGFSSGMATIDGPISAKTGKFPITYTLPVADPMGLTQVTCNGGAALSPRTPCGAAVAAFLVLPDKVTRAVNTRLAPLIGGTPVVYIGPMPVLILSSTWTARNLFTVAYPAVMLNAVAYLDSLSPLPTDGLRTLPFASTAIPGQATVSLQVTASASDSNGNFLYAAVDGSGNFQVAYQDGSLTVTATPTVNYAPLSEFWIWVGPAYVPRQNCDDFYSAFSLVFQIISTENWNNVMWDGMRGTHFMACLYYIFTIVVGFYLFINIFLAILLDNFNTERIDPSKPPTAADASTGSPSARLTRTASNNAIDKLSSFKASSVHSTITRTHSFLNASFNRRTGQPQTPGSSNAALNVPSDAGSSADASVADSAVEKSYTPPNDVGSTSVLGTTSAPLYGPAGASSRRASRRASRRGSSALNTGLGSPLDGRSFLILGPRNPVRLLTFSIVTNPVFETVSLIIIIASTLMLALDSPRLDPGSMTAAAISVMNKIFVILFATEMMLKCIAYGVWMPTNAYLKDGWNVLDGLIAWVGIIDWLVTSFPSGDIKKDPSQLLILQAFRTIRALRPLRVASRLQGIRIVVSALFQAMPGIFNVLMVITLFYGIFAIICMNFFLGQLYTCTWNNGGPQPYGDIGLLGLEQGDNRVYGPVIMDPKSNVQINKQWCNQGVHTITYPPGIPPYTLYTTWVQTYLRSFDHLGVAVLALFEASTTSLWLDVCWAGVDAAGVDVNPVRNFDRAKALLFQVVIIICCYFNLNLFVGVTIDKFVQLKEAAEGNSILLTFEQRQWVEIQEILINCAPQQQVKLPKNRIKRWIYKMVTSLIFEQFIMCVIGATILVMTMRHAREDVNWQGFQFWSNVTFTSIFACEAVLKMIAFGPIKYFKDRWNSFDFFVVLVCFAGVAIDVIQITSGTQKGTSGLSLVRVLRVARIFRLIPKAKRLLKLFKTLFISLPALGNVGGVMFIFFYIFAVVGMTLWGNVRRNYYLKRHANWEDFPNSMLLLFRMTGGENWNGLMHECMNYLSCVLITDPTLPNYNTWYNVNDPAYKTLTLAQYSNHCSPSSEGTIFFFIGMELMLAYLMVNLFIAVILDNFQHTDADELPVSREQVEKFMLAWAEFDPHATYWIESDDLAHLINQLEPPMGVAGLEGNKSKMQAVVMQTFIPDHYGRLHFLEVLHGLAARVAGTRLPPDRESALLRSMAVRVPNILHDGTNHSAMSGLTSSVSRGLGSIMTSLGTSLGGKARVVPTRRPPRYLAAHYQAALYVQAAVRGYLLRHAESVSNPKLQAIKRSVSMRAHGASVADGGLLDDDSAEERASNGGGAANGRNSSDEAATTGTLSDYTASVSQSAASSSAVAQGAATGLLPAQLAGDGAGGVSSLDVVAPQPVAPGEGAGNAGGEASRP